MAFYVGFLGHLSTKSTWFILGLSLPIWQHMGQRVLIADDNIYNLSDFYEEWFIQMAQLQVVHPVGLLLQKEKGGFRKQLRSGYRSPSKAKLDVWQLDFL